MANPRIPPTNDAAQVLDECVVRFAGDSGDGIQLAGSQLTTASALLGNDVSTLPDFPAEIRAPAGTLAGVSGFQVRFSSRDIHTPGDAVDVLVAMNPAALRTNLHDLRAGGLLVVNADAFHPDEWTKAGYQEDPLANGKLGTVRLLAVPMNELNRQAVATVKLTPREVSRCRNFFALGLICWLFERPLEPTLRWIQDRFGKNPAMLEGNTLSLKAGYRYGETTERLPHFRVPTRTAIPPGRYRNITGNQALALALVTASRLAERKLVFASYPITPASDILHHLCQLQHPGVFAVQAEDEMAALGMALGAAFGGALGATSTSGPGMCLKSEFLGLAVMTELPCLVIDVQRGGPSTGLPTKTEQADLLQALYGRNGEAPLVVLAASSPADCFATALEGLRLAMKYMTPVILLSDVYLANGAEPWRIPSEKDLPNLTVSHPTQPNGEREGIPTFLPYLRDGKLVRPWAIPGTPGLEHRIGGLEKEDGTGNVSYDPVQHETMVRLRRRKIDGIADDIPELTVHGPETGDLLVVGWGGTWGAILSAVERSQAQGRSVAAANLRHLHPLPRNTAAVLRRYRKVLVPELNDGQLVRVLRDRFLIDAQPLNKIQGMPFLTSEIEAAIARHLER